MTVQIPRTIRWHGDAVRIIDQTLLPTEYREIDIAALDEVVEAIKMLRVRGAPAIGIAGAMGLVASLKDSLDLRPDDFREKLRSYASAIVAARPTGANLQWAVERVVEAAGTDRRQTSEEIWKSMRDEATAILEEDQAMCRSIGEHGKALIEEGATVLTHCNAGALATGGMGTALAPLYAAAENGVKLKVIATETRPLLQGSRLTTWELSRAGLDVTLITDSSAAATMDRLGVNLVIVGADRIVANGDVANKIGTYMLAIAAAHHKVPFYVAAPTSTFDMGLESGSSIPIEERGAQEVSHGFGRQTAPGDVDVYTPAFDVTPARMIAGIVTEHGIFRAPYEESLGTLRRERQEKEKRAVKT